MEAADSGGSMLHRAGFVCQSAAGWRFSDRTQIVSIFIYSGIYDAGKWSGSDVCNGSRIYDCRKTGRLWRCKRAGAAGKLCRAGRWHRQQWKERGTAQYHCCDEWVFFGSECAGRFYNKWRLYAVSAQFTERGGKYGDRLSECVCVRRKYRKYRVWVPDGKQYGVSATGKYSVSAVHHERTSGAPGVSGIFGLWDGGNPSLLCGWLGQG